MYPMLEDGVSFEIVNKSGIDQYYIKNSKGDNYRISRSLYKALSNANGKSPLDLPEHGKNILPALKHCGLIRTTRYVRYRENIGRYILFPIGKCSRTTRQICKNINALLPAASILMFITGLLTRIFHTWSSSEDFNILVFCLSSISLIILHEVGHIIAGFAYDFDISDAGILFVNKIPIAAYILPKDTDDLPKKHQIQFCLAGIEVNLILIAVFFFASAFFDSLSHTMFMAAIAGIGTVSENIMPAAGGDGMDALNTLFGVDNICELAEKCIKNKKRCRRLLHSGPYGIACLSIMAFTFYSKYILWGICLILMIFLLLFLIVI